MTLTSRDRVMAAFAFEEPDHVPCWLGASPEFRDLAREHLALADDESLSVYLGDDFRRVFPQYRGPEGSNPTEYLENPDATYRTPFGIERHGYGYGQPLNHPLKHATLQEVHDYPWPDPAWMDASSIREEVALWEGQYAILGGDWSPFFHDLIDLLGMEAFFFKMYDEPGVVDTILKYVVDYYASVSQSIFDQAADIIDIFFIGNDFGGQTGPLMGEKLFRRFMLPHLRRLVDLGHDYGLKVMMHCCGGFAPLIPLMIEIELDGLQALQPSARDMKPSKLKTEFGDRILMNGCIDTQHVLIEGTPDLVREKSRQVMDIMKSGGGYVCSPSHDYLLPETPLGNVLALYETVREYGSY